LEVVREELVAIRAELEGMVRESPQVPSQVLAYLDATRVVVFGGSVTIGAALRADDGTPQRRERTSRVVKNLKAMENAARAAYGAIPEGHRRIGAGRDYQEEIDIAFEALGDF
jgi:hypothetical protein